MTGVKRRISCRELFKNFNILPLASKFLLSLSFLVYNMETFQTNSDVHNENTRHNLHVPKSNLRKYERGIKLYNNLPPSIKSLHRDIKVFKYHLRIYFKQ
jgi:hypothetical protein